MKYKAGDRVKLIRPFSGFKSGTLGTVYAYNNITYINSTYLQVRYCGFSYQGNQFHGTEEADIIPFKEENYRKLIYICKK